MPGERTPDQSPSSRQGSTDDEISLREHIQRQIDAQWRYADRLHTDQGAYFERVIADMRDLLDQRFDAQRQAVDELKATTADRFAAVNEFRAQLNDQSRTFITRDESLSRHDRTGEQVAELAKRHEADVAQINSRLDLAAGRGAGLDKGWGYLVALVAAVGGVIAVVIAVTQ